MLDPDGYPSSQDLQKIATWPLPVNLDWTLLMEFIRGLWRYPEYFYVLNNDPQLKHETWNEPPYYVLGTGGWSGHEEIIDALQQNSLFWGMCWWSSNAGGKHIFIRISREIKIT